MRASLPASVKPFAAGARSQQQRGAAPLPPTARLGGGGYGGGSYGGSDRDRRLILPGQETGGSNSGRLVIPGAPGGGSGGSLAGSGAPAVQQNFRPPPGFMDAVAPTEVAPEVAGMAPEEMLNRLRSFTGHWHQLAKLLPALQRAGFDGPAIEEATGLERKIQNVWGTAAQVYESIKAPGLLPPGALEHFDAEGEYLLYELRFLSIAQRAPAAAYIAQHNLSPHESMVLARAIKEHERRNGRREGFADTPADALAYKFYRDAMECRRKEDIETCARKGLAVAETEEARARLAEMLEEQEGPSFALPTAILTTLRLARDELGFRPLAVAGDLQTASADQVLAAPKVASEGVFGNFRVPPHGAGYEWVALPNWSVLTLAGHPVALMIENCADVARIREASTAKTEDELKRLSGQGVVVVDIAAGGGAVQPSQYYLVADGYGRLDLAPGGEAEGAARVLGPILFLARPPSRDTPSATTSELMSL